MQAQINQSYQKYYRFSKTLKTSENDDNYKIQAYTTSAKEANIFTSSARL